MLDFFRRYQRYFFFVITIVIVISFSFFGTYGAIGSNQWREQIAFKAVDGSEILRSDVDDLAHFIATDSEDKRLLGGIWGPNFLNDGVIRQDLLQTGLALELVTFYQDEVKEELQKKLAKEKRYQPYVHPQARFISAENIWNYFVPEMTANLDALRSARDPLKEEAFNARVNLFLAEKNFSAPYLRQALRYQERQYEWLTPDETLNRQDLSLFSYHTLEDWFGPRFVRLVSEFIINAAILAEQNGYNVSREEVLADLVRQAELSYQQNRDNPNLGVASPGEYFNEQLHRLNMDQSRAIKVWRQVMLFRRYFHDVGHVALVDTLPYQQFNQVAKQSAVVDLYRLPAALRFGDFAALQKFETYLQAVSKPVKGEPLALPTQFLSVNEVNKNYPELTQKRYQLEVASFSKKALQGRIGLKETWNWEVDDSNWNALKQQFPDLGTKKGDSREDRFAILDGLDQVTRSRVDAFARAAIIEAHPEWIQQALADASPKAMTIGLRLQGKATPFDGVDTPEKKKAFMALLDQATLGGGEDKLQSYSANGQTYYRIKVLERADKPEILTFAEANEEGTLEDIRNRVLEKYYLSIREQNPTAYKKDDQDWKSFAEVRDQLAEQYFANVLKALQKVQDQLSGKAAKTVSHDQLASLRFYPYIQKVKGQIEKDPAQESQWVKLKSQDEGRVDAATQWLLEKNMTRISRHQSHDLTHANEAFTLPQWGWSAIQTPANGDLAFFQVIEIGGDSEQIAAVAEQTQQAYAMLSADAQRVLMQQVLKELAAKNAISLAYLQAPVEGAESDSQPGQAELQAD